MSIRHKRKIVNILASETYKVASAAPQSEKDDVVVQAPLQGSALNVLQQAPGHVALVVHVGERLEERLLALQTLVPLALDHDPGTLAVDRRVHESLPLNAVALQPRLNNATPDADGGSGVVFGWNHDVVVVLFAGQRLPAVHSKNVRQENRITKPDCSVLVGGTA